MPRCSVIIPAYNDAAYLPEAVGSVLRQIYEDREIIVVDDGSTDETQKILEEFGSRIRVIHQENQGPSAARNTGFLQAKGEILSFLDSDDLWFPYTLECQEIFLREHPEIDMVFGYMDAMDKEGHVFPDSAGIGKEHYKKVVDKGISYERSTLDIAFSFNTCAIRKKSLEALGGLDIGIRACEDGDFFLRATAFLKIAFLDEKPLARVRFHDGGLGFERFHESLISVLKKHLSLVETRSLPVNLKVAARNLRLNLSNSSFHLGNKPDGRKYYLAAVAGDQTALFSYHHFRTFILSFVPPRVKNFWRPFLTTPSK